MHLIKKIRTTLSTFRPLHLIGIFFLCFLFVVSIFFQIKKINSYFLTEVPAYGGYLKEAVVGVPRFINPVLSISQSDRDITSLIYSGLTREDENKEIIPDLAESYIVSEDGLTYTFTLKQNIYFHDGEPVTVDDVIYTIELVQSEQLKSPRKIEWEGVKVEKKDDQTLEITLKKPYQDFLKNTSIGILPKHIWKELDFQTIPLSDINLSPIGSGPYKISNIHKKNGVPDTYTLSAFSNFALGKPYISEIDIKIYQNQEELYSEVKKGSVINVAQISSDNASFFKDSSSLSINISPLPRIYSLFINQAKNKDLQQKNVREAISKAIDKKRITTEALYGYGFETSSPIPKSLIEEAELSFESVYSKEEAKSILEKEGFEKTEGSKFYSKKEGDLTKELSVTITTIASVPELEKTAEIIKENLEEVGVRVTINSHEISDINQRIIKDRSYEILLYGMIVQNPTDLYAFWHSSQKTDPGLNLSMYANTKVDSSLESIRSKKSNLETNSSEYKIIDTEIKNDLPAIFLFNSEFVYLSDKNIKIFGINNINNSQDRFKVVYKWYENSEYVWRGIENIEILKKIRNKLN